MKLSVIIVSWNVNNLLRKCLESLYKNPPTCRFEVIVIDNASSDHSCQMVKELFPKAILIENARNLGFSCANNQGIRRSGGEFLLILNPDTEVLPGSLDLLISFLENNAKTGAAAPKVLNPDLTLQKSVMGFPEIGRASCRERV